MSGYTRPENALQKARDLLVVKKPYSALASLHAMLQSKRYRQWSSTHEEIMNLYVDLSVEQRLNLKDALMLYRSISQYSNPTSLEKVLRRFVDASRDRVIAAEAEAKAKGIDLATEAMDDAADSDVVEDSKIDDDPAADGEDIQLKDLMSDEAIKARSDRKILLPWVRYMWDTYRTVLDLLRNNIRMERVYHEMARQCFAFCAQHRCISEFRRCCELLRSHLAMINRFQGQSNSLDLSNPETQRLYLETHFDQLRISSRLELWQEAYRSIEDIYESQRKSKTEPPVELSRLYFDKLSEIFWAAKNLLFHAYSMFKSFQLALRAPASGATDATTDLQRHADAVLLAALSVPLAKIDDDAVMNNRTDGHTRLALLLGFKKELPTRPRLFALLASTGVTKYASPDVVRIFDTIEHQFAPLSLYSLIAPQVAALDQNEQLAKYTEPLKQTIVIRVLTQVATVFKTIKVDRFLSLVPTLAPKSRGAASSARSLVAIERLLMSSVRSELVHARIDHSSGLLHFVEESLEGSRSRDQLALLSRSLVAIAERIQPADVIGKLRQRQHVFGLIAQGMPEEEEDARNRAAIIEQRKADEVREAQAREREEQERAARQQAERKLAEQRRVEELNRKREEARAAEARAEEERRAKSTLAAEVSKKVDASIAKVAKNTTAVLQAQKKLTELLQDPESVDRAKVLAAQQEILDRQRRDLERRRRESARKHDFFVRALRMEERTLLIDQEQKTREERKEQLDQEYVTFVEAEKKLFERQMAERTRMMRIVPERDVFIAKAMERRREAWVEQKKAQHVRFLQAREAHEAEMERIRVERELAERERQRLAAEEAARRAEEERIQQEREAERQRLAKEREDHRRKLFEEAQARMKREQELEERDRQARTGASAGASAEESAGGRVPLRLEPRKPAADGAAPGPWRRSEAPAAGGADESRNSQPRDQRDQPRFGFNRDREQRSYGDREQRSFGGDREQRSFGGDREQRSYGGDREQRSFGGDREQRSFGGDREQRSYGGDREQRSFGGDREQRSYGGDREQRSYGGDRDRSFGGRGASGSDRSGAPRSGPSDDKWQRRDRDASSNSNRDFADLRRSKDNSQQ